MHGAAAGRVGRRREPPLRFQLTTLLVGIADTVREFSCQRLSDGRMPLGVGGRCKKQDSELK